MTLIHPKKLFDLAKKNNTAIGAFNVLNLETLKGVIQAAEETKIPLIIQITPGALKWAEYEYLVPMVKSAINNSSAEIVLHLDHCQDIELLNKAANDGFTSIMFDGSHFSFDENVRLSKIAKSICEPKNIFLELEIGKIGGKEDDLVADKVEVFDINTIINFYNLTKPDTLAIAFGTSHGIYKKSTELDYQLINNANQNLDIPLVMHGTSGISYKNIKKCITNGITKINIATDLLIVYNQAIFEYLQNDPKSYDIRKINTSGITAIKNKVIEYLKLFQ